MEFQSLLKSIMLDNSLLPEMSLQHKEELKNGSGNPLEQIELIHSSAGLAVYYFLLLEKTGNIENMHFEWKESRPLKHGNVVNIDVNYTIGNAVYFVESKFLEPYYSGNEKVRSSYQEHEKYKKSTKHIDKWIDLFCKANEGYKYFNAVQMCRHLLAISSLASKKGYKDKKIVLQSYIWMMPDAFIGLLPPDKQHDCKQIRKELQDEEIKFKMNIDEFIDTVLADCNISFEIKHYNDSEVLNAINNDPQFIQRYYLD